MAVSSVPMFTFDHAAVISHGDGKKSLRWHAGATDAQSSQVFSLQPDGSIQTRPDTQIGDWEKGTVEGDRLVFRVGDARAVFAWQD
jgi:hypothetical protein